MIAMKRILAVAISFVLVVGMLALSGCGNTGGDASNPSTARQRNQRPANDKTANDPMVSVKRSYDDYTAQDGSWAVYIYMCGSDLESRAGAATQDIKEMLQVTLPANVKVVIETGGALEWRNDAINADELGRYLYTGSSLMRADSQPLANMADPDTVAAFLDFCNREYPAQHQVVVFWDHGGGSLMGSEKDELYGGDLLSLPEMRAAFNAMPAASGLYEVVGFDACIMATMDVADVLDEHARYLVGSEESEPAPGWDYEGMLKALAAGVSDGEQLGREICDSFYGFCENQGKQKDITLSVTDLSRFKVLLAAYEDVGDEALLLAHEQTKDFYSAFERAAYASENYGIVDGTVSSCDMVDLGDLIRNTADLLEGDDALLAALDECVLYQVKGEMRSKASGLACYFPYSADVMGLDVFSSIGTSRGFEYLYEYPLYGQISPQAADYVDALVGGMAAGEEFPVADVPALDDFRLRHGDENDPNTVQWVLDLGPELVKNVSNITTESHYAIWDEANDRIQASVILGYDTNFNGDWGRGWFQDGFRGYWYNLGGSLVTVWADQGTLDLETGLYYSTMRVPVLLNGESYTIEVHHTAWVTQQIVDSLNDGDNAQIAPSDLHDEKYEVYGARRANDPQTGVPSKELHELVPGDVIEPLFQVFSYDYTTAALGDGQLETKAFETLTWTNSGLAFTRESLGDGRYYTSFNITDLVGDKHESDIGWYLVQDGRIAWMEFN
jgi:hypothetical protein